jgi:hypothetical protein
MFVKKQSSKTGSAYASSSTRAPAVAVRNSAICRDI